VALIDSHDLLSRESIAPSNAQKPMSDIPTMAAGAQVASKLEKVMRPAIAAIMAKHRETSLDREIRFASKSAAIRLRTESEPAVSSMRTS
jgi:hypothetical protein